jgi:hypothetical protein
MDSYRKLMDRIGLLEGAHSAGGGDGTLSVSASQRLPLSLQVSIPMQSSPSSEAPSGSVPVRPANLGDDQPHRSIVQPFVGH